MLWKVKDLAVIATLGLLVSKEQRRVSFAKRVSMLQFQVLLLVLLVLRELRVQLKALRLAWIAKTVISAVQWARLLVWLVILVNTRSIQRWR